jgi:hypothetical protein
MLRDEVCEFLRSEGHEPTLTTSGNEGDYGHIRFRARGNKYVVHTIEDDPQFLHITVSFEFPIWRLDNRILHETLLEAQRRLKVVKFSLANNGDAITVHAEQFVTNTPSTMHFRMLFWRAVDALDEAFDMVIPRLKSLDSPRAAAGRFIDEFSGSPTSRSERGEEY